MTDHNMGEPADAGATRDDAERTRRSPVEQVALQVGGVIGARYRLNALVATDHEGNQFWKARDTVLPRDMALTIIPDANATSPIVTASLRCGRLGHGGLPQTLDAGEVGSAAYLAGQWVDGVSIQTLLADGPVEPVIAQRITSHIADALAAIHAAGLALGAIHPALVRVNVDGQIRLSHLVARLDASPQDDIRAVGALLYLLLTDSWPLDSAPGPDGVAAARRHGDAIAAPHSVNQLVPQELSNLAQQALVADPETRAGRRLTMASIAASTRAARYAGDMGPAVGANHPSHQPRAPHRTARPVRRKPSWSDPLTETVVKERRVKLSIASGMLIVLAALMVITGSSITKQFLAAIVAPINASNHEILTSSNPPTTTRTIGSPTAGSGDGSSGTDKSETADATAPQQVAIADATVYDPQGDGNKDYVSYVAQAFDGDEATVWKTWVYQQQFGPGGIKDGVGLLLRFDAAVSPASVTISTTTPDTTASILAVDNATPTLADLDTLATATLSADPVSISLTDAPTSQYLLVWLTKIAPHTSETSSSSAGFQSTIAEISVTGIRGNAAG